MVAGRLVEEANAAFYRSPFDIPCAVIEPADARKRNGRRTHGAGFERDIKIRADQPLLPQGLASHPQRHDFRMRRDIVPLTGAISAASDDLAIQHHNRADRHLIALFRPDCLLDRRIHETICPAHAAIPS